jgi:hypothetical protein
LKSALLIEVCGFVYILDALTDTKSTTAIRCRTHLAIHPSNSKIDSKFTSDIQNYALVASRWYFGEAQLYSYFCFVGAAAGTLSSFKDSQPISLLNSVIVKGLAPVYFAYSF